ncbi:MAG: TIGR02302 family protein [Rhodospirillaceae bacterium]
MPYHAGTPTPPRQTLITARLVLVWERMWRALWPASSLLGAFIAVALLDILPVLPGWLHGLTLLMSAAFLVYLVRRRYKNFRWPEESEALRRLERDSGLAHRPLLTLRDHPASDHPPSAAIWQAHCQQVASRASRLRLRLPHPKIGDHDPFHLRLVAALALVISAAWSWGDWPLRLRAALVPQLDSPGRTTKAAFDLWLVPPTYTGFAPIFLHHAVTGQWQEKSAEKSEPITVPAGSVVLARLSGGGGVPELMVNETRFRFKALDHRNFQVQEILRGGTAISIDQDGRTLGKWPISIIADRPPTIGFSGPPATGERGTLRLEYFASDDYGIAAITATIRPDPTTPLRSQNSHFSQFSPSPSSPNAISLPLPQPAPNQKNITGVSVQDLTDSPWAGLPVLIGLSVTDTGDNHSKADEVAMMLPERIFANPIARQLISERKKLMIAGEGARAATARALSAISIKPGAYHDDTVTFLALRVAVAQLFRDMNSEVPNAVAELLWQTALRLEDGGLSLAEHDFRDAERALAEALDRNAPAAELQLRINDLEAALGRVLESLERQAQNASTPNTGKNLTADQIPTANQIIDGSDLESMITALRDMAETGSRKDARQLLTNLRQLLDNLRGDDGGNPDQAKNLEALHRLEDITAGQHELLDRSLRAQPENESNDSPDQDGSSPSPTLQSLPRPYLTRPPITGPNRRGKPAGNDEANKQGQLRHQLGETMQQLDEIIGEIPQSLGRAERAMNDAERTLSQGGNAAASQAQAVDELQQGMRGLVNKMGGSGVGRDPLGRRLPGFGAPGLGSSNVKVPKQGNIQRSREILDELRRRANQGERPRHELNYIERLLRQF